MVASSKNKIIAIIATLIAKIVIFIGLKMLIFASIWAVELIDKSKYIVWIICPVKKYTPEKKISAIKKDGKLLQNTRPQMVCTQIFFIYSLYCSKNYIFDKFFLIFCEILYHLCMKILIVSENTSFRTELVRYIRNFWHYIDIKSPLHQDFYRSDFLYDLCIFIWKYTQKLHQNSIEKIRNNRINIPIFCILETDNYKERAELLLFGADDCVFQKMNMTEIYARIFALWRRKHKKIETKTSFCNYELCFEKRKLTDKNQNEIILTAKEYAILEFLAKNMDFPQTKTDILEAVWWFREAELSLQSVALEVHISSLRKKLGKSCILTFKWVGYILKNNA